MSVLCMTQSIGGRMLESCYNLEPGIYEFDERSFFQTDTTVNILGLQYSSKDVEKVKEDVRSRLWFSYRRNFSPIGGTGPTSDQGWGCMLRCGQMLLAHTLILKHLGRDWRWSKESNDESYKKILNLFSDKKDKLYSLHQIAQMGVSEGKVVGDWFGPNTVCQVLKKLCVYDCWSSVSIHVAMDNAVIINDLYLQAKTTPKPAAPPESLDWPSLPNTTEQCDWRPLLILVPLRLGLANLNDCYVPTLKALFTIPQCVGIIGGRPNHALYFVGCVADEMIYLDPHECQQSVVNNNDDDATYHCPFILHMPINNIDPSLAIGFLCQDETSFLDLCAQLKQKSICQGQNALFELLDKRPSYWPSFVPYTGEDTPKIPEFAVMEPHYDTDEDFEILEG